ncbi:DNA polymerase III subunit gamma/tau [Candidatus Uhrbacteria bacterium]|jgi:DNA polymerase III subunit gamma/tau|nr:DNA polymerase III subunit gamma/tau [Candidatus Uhrbacteria bacterium]MBT7717211.1 DNA polymerase III subunit gamma/tau [Candidatus Uhrbacteria bacterium]
MSKGLSRTYRPSQFSDVFGQKHVVQTIQNQVADDKIAHAYLFAGPRGIGKTTIARLLAKTANCEDRAGKSEACGKCKHCKAFDDNGALDVVEIDAASNTGVDNVRENIIEAIRFAPTSGSHKVFIIDEVHMLSASAFNALLKTLEEPPEYGIFVLATTELHKIPQTIISRCQRFDFHRLTADETVERLNSILKAENVEVDDEVLKTIAKLSEGCLRDAESLLSQIMALGEKNITQEIASIVLPRTNTQTVSEILGSCTESNAKSAIESLQSFVESGGSVKRLNDDLIEECRIMMMENLGKDANKIAWFRSALESFLKARITHAPETIPHLPLEIAIIEICGSSKTNLPLPKGEVEGVAVDQPEPKIEVKQEPVVESRKEPDEKPVDKIEASEPRTEEKNTDMSSVFSIEELRPKWKRCCDEVSKTNIALPLALKDAQLIEIEDGVLLLGFELQFHVDTVNQRKNLDAISEGIARVMPNKVSVIVKHVPKEKASVPVQNLAAEFGGSVVE